MGATGAEACLEAARSAGPDCGEWGVDGANKTGCRGLEAEATVWVPGWSNDGDWLN